jgi:hypothetical protein
MALMNDLDLQPLLKRGFSKEAGCLFQGICDIKGTNTCLFVELTNIPKDRKITYGKISCEYKPLKKEKERVKLTVGGDRLDYPGDVATSTAEITTFQNSNQHHTIHGRRCYDDDGHHKLLSGRSFASV